MALSFKLKKVLDERGMSVYKLGELMGLKQPVMLYPYYHGKVKNWNVETLKKMCRVLEIKTIDELIEYLPDEEKTGE